MTSAYAIVIIIRRYLMLVTDAYETVKSTPSSMDYLYTQDLEYRSYWLSISGFFPLKISLDAIFLYVAAINNV